MAIVDLQPESWPISPVVAESDPISMSQSRNLGQEVCRLALQGISQVREYGHQLINGDYSEKFKREFKERHHFVVDGVPLTVRVLNPEFLDNDEPVVCYNYSLTVPAKHGAELPTVADIAEHGLKTQRAVVATTTDGLAGPIRPDKLWSLTDFNNIGHRRWEVYRKVLKPGKEIIATGSSLGGMMSHYLAATAEEESRRSRHPLFVIRDIAIASAGHHYYGPEDAVATLVQFGFQEPVTAARYVLDPTSPKQRAQRFFELFGTISPSKQQLVTSALIGLGILKAPLLGVETALPDHTSILDVTFDKDRATHPHLRQEDWSDARHPAAIHVQRPGTHLALLTDGRELTLQALSNTPTSGPGLAAA